MPQHDDRTYLAHIRDFAKTVLEVTHGKQRCDLDRERLLRYALLHLMCVLGEAASRVSQDCRAENSELPWRAMIATRNHVIHGYDVVDLDILWETVEKDLAPLVERLDSILGEQ